MYDLGKKRKMLVFTGVYVCVKAKLTFVSFFSQFFYFAPFPNRTWKILKNVQKRKNKKTIQGVSKKSEFSESQLWQI